MSQNPRASFGRPGLRPARPRPGAARPRSPSRHASTELWAKVSPAGKAYALRSRGSQRQARDRRTYLSPSPCRFPCAGLSAAPVSRPSHSRSPPNRKWYLSPFPCAGVFPAPFSRPPRSRCPPYQKTYLSPFPGPFSLPPNPPPDQAPACARLRLQHAASDAPPCRPHPPQPQPTEQEMVPVPFSVRGSLPCAGLTAAARGGPRGSALCERSDGDPCLWRRRRTPASDGR